jgi:hypothetical protein
MRLSQGPMFADQLPIAFPQSPFDVAYAASVGPRRSVRGQLAAPLGYGCV